MKRDPNAVLILFAGAADGWGVGLDRAGYRIVALAESDPDRRAALRKHHPEAVIYEDVRAVTRERLVRDLGYLPGVVVGSPPCQDISSANNGKAQGVDGDRSGLYFEAIRIVGEVRPDWYALENSPFVKTRGYDRLHAALEAVGYACWPSVVGAVHAGFFHLRKRSWLAGVDGAHAQGEPLGSPGQPWPCAPDAAHADGDGEQQPQGAFGEVGRRPGHGRAWADADAGRADPAGRASHRGRGAGAGAPGGTAAYSCEGEQRIKSGRRRGEDGASTSVPQGKGEQDAGHPDSVRRQEVRESVGGDLPKELAALERAARALGLGGRSRLVEHYRMAAGLRAGLARLCISAYGDALVPDIAEAFGRVMPQLLAELKA